MWALHRRSTSDTLYARGRRWRASSGVKAPLRRDSRAPTAIGFILDWPIPPPSAAPQKPGASMGSTLKNSGLVSLGVIAGITVSMQFSALAQKTVEPGMPLDSLRQLADVYGIIKTDYVEPVDDKR